MQSNKPKRVRSAVILRPSSVPKIKPSIASTKTLQKQYENQEIIDFGTLKPITIEHQKSKQNEFRSTIRKLPTSHSKKSLLTQAGFTEYNSQTWRTVHSAKSLTRLQSLKRFKEKDPIKINLQEKVLRIKSKHNETQIMLSARTQKAQQFIQGKVKGVKVDHSNIISMQINQIIKKWQSEKIHSTEVYRKKIELLAQHSQTKLNTFRPRVPQTEIKWQIC